MNNQSHPEYPGPRATLAWVFAALGVFWLALIYQLGAQWSIYDQYSYGWSVPFLCVFLLWQRVRAADGGTKSFLPNFQLPSSICYFLLVVCALLYAPTRFFHEANPIWRLTSLLWALEVIVITLVLLPFVLWNSNQTGASRSACGISNLVFPVCFFLVAVPWPSGLEYWLVQTLTRLNVAGTVNVLGFLDIPALQHGNVIEVASGDVSVDPACSGIRSFQATLMMALFFGEFYRLNVPRRAACVLAGFAFSFLFNLARTTLLTWVQAKKGPQAMAAWHDPVGTALLVGCFFAVWFSALWLRGTRQKTESGKQKTESGNGGAKILKAESRQTESAKPDAEISGGAAIFTPATIRRLAIALLVWFGLVEAGTQFWFWRHETTTAARQQWTVDVTGANAWLNKVAIPADISSQFRANEGIEARGRDEAGNFWQLYYFRWLPARSLAQRVAIQLAKTHGPEVCLPAVGMILKSDLGVITMHVGGREFALRQFVFQAGDRLLHVFYAIYEDPTGSAVLANRRKDTASRIAAALAGSRNDGQRFLEIAIFGPDNAAAAEAAVHRELEKLIRSN